MAEHKAKPLFEYHPAFKFGPNDRSLSFVEQVCTRIGCGGMPPENPLLERPIHIVGTPSETERLVCWLCHAWHMQLDPLTEPVPELAAVRDVVVLYKVRLRHVQCVLHLTVFSVVL